jgi:hypothetical protein
VLAEIVRLAHERRLSFTHKSLRELAALGIGLDVEDARQILVDLQARDSVGRRQSETTGEWMYIFKPTLEATVLYVKVIIRADCVVISFHADEGSQ